MASAPRWVEKRDGFVRDKMVIFFAAALLLTIIWFCALVFLLLNQMNDAQINYHQKMCKKNFFSIKNYRLHTYWYLSMVLNMSWIKRLSLFGGNWKSPIFEISIGINDHIHKDHKNQVDLFFQLFVYISQQFNQNLLKKQVL